MLFGRFFGRILSSWFQISAVFWMKYSSLCAIPWRQNFIWSFGTLSLCKEVLSRLIKIQQRVKNVSALLQNVSRHWRKCVRSMSNIMGSLNKPVCLMWTLLCFSAPYHSLTITCSLRILQSADILSVPPRPLSSSIYLNQYYVNLSRLKTTSKVVGHCHTEMEHANLYKEPNLRLLRY